MRKVNLILILGVTFMFVIASVSFAKNPISISTPLCKWIPGTEVEGIQVPGYYEFYDCTQENPCAPQAKGPYSQAIKYGELVFLAGQLPLDPCKGSVVGDDITAQTEQVMKNLGAVLKAAGLTFKDVISTTVYLADILDFGAFNTKYAESFGCELVGGNWECEEGATPPARATVQLGVKPFGDLNGSLLEVSMIAGK